MARQHFVTSVPLTYIKLDMTLILQVMLHQTFPLVYFCALLCLFSKDKPIENICATGLIHKEALLVKTASCFIYSSSKVIPIIFPPSLYFCYLTVLPKWATINFVNLCQFKMQKMVSHCYFNLYFSGHQAFKLAYILREELPSPQWLKFDQKLVTVTGEHAAMTPFKAWDEFSDMIWKVEPH